MSKTNNRRLRARVRDLEFHVQALLLCCRCAYCDEIMLSDREELLAHAKVCPQHPCRAIERERDAARRSLCTVTAESPREPFNVAVAMWGSIEAARLFPDSTTLADMRREAGAPATEERARFVERWGFDPDEVLMPTEVS
jgi:hypothetical protein